MTHSALAWLGIFSLIGSALLALKLLRTGLYRHYPILFGYFVFLVPFTTVPLVLDTRSKTYFTFWVFSEPLFWILELLVVRELCGKLLEKYKGLSTLGNWMIYFSTAVAGTISVLSLLPRITSHMAARSRLLFYLMGAGRAVNCSLALFLILMLFLLSRYPVRLSRNVVVNLIAFTTFFISNTLTAILHQVFDLRLSTSIDTASMAISCVCQLVWLFVLSADGEIKPPQPLLFASDDQQRVLTRLDSFNKLLLAAAGQN